MTLEYLFCLAKTESFWLKEVDKNGLSVWYSPGPGVFSPGKKSLLFAAEKDLTRFKNT